MEKSDILAESEKLNLPPLNTEHLQDIPDTCFLSDRCKLNSLHIKNNLHT